MIADFDDVLEFVKGKCREAKDGSETIVFPVEKHAALSESVRNRQFGGGIQASHITDDPRYEVLKHGTGQSAWAAVLSVDLRKSTDITGRIGAEKTYLLMHTYLPTMAYLVGRAEGKVIGLRGDGLFAGFGITEVTTKTDEVSPEVATEAVGNAVNCGHAMIEALEDAVTPVLRNEGLDDDLRIGVGVDIGHVIITRIGLETASEVTAYGAVVNHVCKKFASQGRNQVCISHAAREMFPKSKGGRVTFSSFNGGYFVNYPSDQLMLTGDSNNRRRRPR